MMDKDLVKGLLILICAVAAVVGLFFVVAESGPDKAECIANALKSGVAFANIDKTCKLTATRPSH